MEEELRSKLSQLKRLKDEVKNAYKELREECSFLRFVAITGMLNTLRNSQYDEMLKCHVSKLSRLIVNKFDIN